MTALLQGGGTNDDQVLMVFDGTGNAIDSVAWDEARDRIAAFLMAGTSNEGWALARAEDALCAVFTGRSRTHG